MKQLKNKAWGIFFILTAILVLLSELGIFSLGISAFDFILTVLLVVTFFKSLCHLSYFGMFISLALLGIVYDEALGIETLTPFPILLIAILLSIGFNFLFGGFDRFKKHDEGNFIEEEINSSDSIVNITTSFGATTKYINSKDVEKININAKFSACKLYLDKASLKDNELVVNFDISFSGVEVYVPKEWKVINNVSCSLGGIDEKNRAEGSNDMKVTLTGKCSLAGIEIIYI